MRPVETTLSAQLSRKAGYLNQSIYCDRLPVSSHPFTSTTTYNHLDHFLSRPEMVEESW